MKGTAAAELGELAPARLTMSPLGAHGCRPAHNVVAVQCFLGGRVEHWCDGDDCFFGGMLVQ
jgi:hypothetical protein